MSHVALVPIADWLASETGTYGLNTLMDTLPRYSTDSAPEVPQVYDEWRHRWVIKGLQGDVEDATAEITTPCVAIKFNGKQTLRDPYAQASTNMVKDDLFNIAGMIAVREPDVTAASRHIGYLARLVENSLWALGFGTDTQRTATGMGVRLGRMQNFTLTGLQAPIGDLTAIMGFSAQYHLTESTVVPV